MKYPRTATFLLSLLLACPLTACSTKQEIPEFTAHYYPECYDPIDRLCKDRDSNRKLKESAVGGMLGGLTGAGIGFLASGDYKGALVGGVAGAVGGAAIGYFHAHLAEIKDRSERLAEYKRLLGDTANDWDLERASVETSYRCYRKQIQHLTRLVKAKKISREEFLARMDEIDAGIENINTYWADAQSRIDQRIANGRAFLESQDKDDKRASKNKTTKMRTDLRKASRMTDKKEKDIAKGKEKTNKIMQATISDMDALRLAAKGALLA